MQKLSQIGTIAFAFFLISACGESARQSSPVAEFAGETLYEDDLALHLPANDTGNVRQQIIQKWADEIALVQHARERLQDLDSRIAAKMADYRREMIIQELRRDILTEKLDTTVTPEELRDYYNANANQFLASRPLYNYRYVITSNWDTPQYRKRLGSDDRKDIRIREEWAVKHAQLYKMNGDYLPAAELKQLQSKYFPKFNLLSVRPGTRVLVETNESIPKPTIHFFYMADVLPAGAPLPLGMVQEQIKAVILQQRKLQVVKTYESEIIQQARNTHGAPSLVD